MSTTPVASFDQPWGNPNLRPGKTIGSRAFAALTISGSENDIEVYARVPGTNGNSLKVQAANLSGYSTPIQSYQGGIPATATISPSSGTDIIFISQNPGGDDITIAYAAQTEASQAISVAISGSAITVNLASDAGTAQVETATAAGTITGAGNATVTVTSAILAGSPLAVSVAVALNDTAATWAGKVRTALGENEAIAALYTVGGSSTSISLTARTTAANDTTLNIALANGTCTGITNAGTSTNSTAGVAPAPSSTAANIVAAVNGSILVNNIVRAYLTEASSGAVSAVTATSLTGGTTDADLTYVVLGTNSSGSVNSTATQLVSALENNLISANLKSGDDGSGTVAAISVTTLSGGTDSTGLAGNVDQERSLEKSLELNGRSLSKDTKHMQPTSGRNGASKLNRSIPAQEKARYAVNDGSLQQIWPNGSPFR
jgi:hypothetical protein